MPANLVWIQRPHIVCMECRGEVTSGEILEIIVEVLKIVERRPTYLVIDATQVNSYPNNLVNFFYSHTVTVDFIQHVNNRALVLVKGSQALRMAIEIIMRNRTYAAFDEMEPALMYLRRYIEADKDTP